MHLLAPTPGNQPRKIGVCVFWREAVFFIGKEVCLKTPCATQLPGWLRKMKGWNPTLTAAAIGGVL